MYFLQNILAQANVPVGASPDFNQDWRRRRRDFFFDMINITRVRVNAFIYQQRQTFVSRRRFLDVTIANMHQNCVLFNSGKLSPLLDEKDVRCQTSALRIRRLVNCDDCSVSLKWQKFLWSFMHLSNTDFIVPMTFWRKTATVVPMLTSAHWPKIFCYHSRNNLAMVAKRAVAAGVFGDIYFVTARQALGLLKASRNQPNELCFRLFSMIRTNTYPHLSN